MAILQIPSKFPVDLLVSIPGASVKDGKFEYPGSADEAKAAIEKTFEGRKYTEVTAKAYEPSEDDLRIARSYFGDENYPVENLVFRKMDTANTLKDRDDDILDKSFHDELARQVNTESRVMLLQHNPNQVIGRKFRAEVIPATFPNGETGWQLVEYAYFLKNYVGPGNITIGELLSSGTIQDVSIGFFGSGRKYDEGARARTFYHEPGRTQTENLETSLVHMGAQYYSRVSKSIKDFTAIIDNKVPKMEKVHLTIGAEVKEFTTEAEIQKAFTTVTASEKSAKAERDDLQKQVDSLKTPLVSNIINREKALKDENWSEEELKSFTLDKLQKMSESLDARYKAANPQLNDPTNQRVTGGNTDKKSPMDVFKEMNKNTK